MRTERSTGKRLTWTNTTGLDVASGQLVLIGTTGVGVACTDIPNLATGELAVSEEHEVAKTVAEAWAQGDVLWLVVATGMLSNVAGNAVAGKATKTLPPGTATGFVKLTDGVLSAPAAATVTAASLANAVADQLANLSITAGAEAAHARTITIQALDAQGNALAARVLLDLMVNPTNQDTTPTATGTDVFAAPTAGIIVETVVALAHYRVQTDANGQYVFEITHNDAGTSRFIQAACQGLVATSGEIAFDAV